MLGFLWPAGPLLLMAQMMMAIVKVHSSKGFWNSEGGVEFPLTLLTVGFVLGLTGPGVYSLDHALGFALPEPEAFLAGLTLITIGVLLGLYSAPLRGLFERRRPIEARRPHQPRL